MYLQESIDHFDLLQKVERSLEGRNASVAEKLEHLRKEVGKEQDTMMKNAKKEALQPKGYKDDRELDKDLKAAIANLAQNINPQNAQQQQQVNNARVRSRSANILSS